MESNGPPTEARVITRRNLTHPEFYALCKYMETNPELVPSCKTWRQAAAILSDRLKEVLGAEAPGVSPGTVQQACEIVKQTISGRPRKARNHRQVRDDIHILARAMCKIYNLLNEPMPAGLQHLVDAARRKSAGDNESDNTANIFTNEPGE